MNHFYETVVHRVVMARTKEQKMAAVYEKFMEDPAKQLSPSESAAVMAHLGTVVAAQEKTMRQQQETISTLKEELETLKSALEDNAKAVSMFDSLPDEILLDIIKVAARHGADQQGRHSTSGQWRGEGGPYPPIASSRLAILGSPEYNHDFIVDVIGKISKRFSRLAHDKSLWTGTVVISLDGDMRHELGGWEYGEKTADKIIFEWLHDGTEHLWMDGENPCTKVATFDFHSLAKRCPKLKTLLLYSVELEESLKSSKFQMPYLENLFLHVVDLSYSDPFDGFDWQFTFPSIKLFGMWPDMTPGEYGDGWSLFPDLRDCHNLKEVYVMGGKYSFPTNLSEDVPFPRCLKKLVLHDHGLTNYKWYVKNGMKTLNSQEIRDAIEEYLPNCGMFYENLGCRNSPINCVPSDDSEYEDDEDEEDDDEEEEEGEEDNEEEEEEVEEEEEQENDDHVDNVGESVDTSEEEGTEEESDWDRNHDELSTFGTHSKAYKHLDYRVGIRSNCHGNKKALLIGINYFGQSRELNGCVNDVANMKKLILTRGYKESAAHMRVLTDDSRIPTNQPTKRNIIEGMHMADRKTHNFVLIFYKRGISSSLFVTNFQVY